MSYDALSPLDGRYREQVESLAPLLSEYGLMRARVHVEVEWLVELASLPEISEVPPLEDRQQQALRGLAVGFDEESMERVKQIEAQTRHDVKAVERFIVERLAVLGLPHLCNWVHFACTSEDINNLAYARTIGEAIHGVWRPAADAVISEVTAMAKATAALPMLAHTHGQPATPTTLGKELAVFAYRWGRQMEAVSAWRPTAKFNGASGTFSAHVSAYPDIDWPAVSRRFVERLGFVWNPLTTQIEPHDTLAELFHALMRTHAIGLDFAVDMWTYISKGYLAQRVEASEVGSSTMPHKVNPINFENAEANFGLSTALLTHLAAKLATSRLQRDLSDSSALRAVASALGHSVVAWRALARGLAAVEPDPAALAEDLDGNWQVLGEAVQTVMRKHGLPDPYEQLKTITRGQRVDGPVMRELIAGLPIPGDDKARLLALSPATYTGLAERLLDYL